MKRGNVSSNIVAIITARGGSKTVPRKNIRLLSGKPLIYYTIKEAQTSKYVHRVLVSTEDREIAEITKGYGAEVVPRPVELAQDDTPSLPVFRQVIKYLEDVEDSHPDVVVLLQPTSPLRTAEDIDGAIEKFLHTNCDSIVSVCEAEHPPQWMYILEGDRLKPIIGGREKVTRRQDAPKVYRLNGAIYVTRSNVIIKQNTVVGHNTGAYIMPLERSIDIDTELDFRLTELLMREREATEE